MMFCRRSWISQELENVIYSFQCRSSLDWIMPAEKSSVLLLLFQENVKVWIIQIGFNQSFVFGNNLHFFFRGKVLSGTAQFRLLPLAKLQLSGEKFLYIFQTRFMGGGVYRVCTVQSEVTW